MPRTSLNDKDHRALVDACGGVVVNVTEAILGSRVGKDDLGNLGAELKIAAIRAHYRVS